MKNLMECLKLNVLKAIIARVVFAIHSFVAVFRVVVAYQEPLFWLLLLSLIGLLIETVVTLVKRSGKEWTWFSPAIFCYLLAAVPPIWLLELQLSQLRILEFSQTPNPINATNIDDALVETIGIHISLDLAGWALAMEQALLFILILGRWFMPKGNISKNQLSQILLVYIGMAADIMELFEVFKEEQVALSHLLTYPTLTLWSIALFQYTLVISTTKAKKPRFGDLEDEEFQTNEALDKSTLITKCGLDSVKIDVLGIMTTIIMQDGPFLCYRLYLLVGFRVISQMMVFFTCKNLLVILLQIYRLIVIYKDFGKDDTLSKTELNKCAEARRRRSTQDAISFVSSENITNNIRKRNIDQNNTNHENINKNNQLSFNRVSNRVTPSPIDENHPIIQQPWSGDANADAIDDKVIHPSSISDDGGSPFQEHS